MPVTSLSIFAGFDLILGKIIIQDITDYLDQGLDFGTVPPDTVNGFIKIEYDAGNGWVPVYNNLIGPTPDMTPPTVIDFSSVSIPLGTDGLPLAANYRITYKVDIDQPNVPVAYSVEQQFSYQYNFVKPVICISSSVDCAASTITSIDDTDYIVSGATVESLTRAHSLFPPPASGMSQVGPANLVTLIATPIVTTTWTAQIQTTASYVQSDGLHVVVVLTASKEIAVTCDTNLSKALCCINQINNTLQGYRNDPIKYANYKRDYVDPTWNYLLLFLAATTAGNPTKQGLYYSKILEYSGCGDCGCNDSISLVTPSSVGGNQNQIYVVDSPTGSVSVVQSVAGSVTTFHVEVSANILNIINNLASIIAVAGDGTYITVTPSGSNPVTWTVSYTGPAIHANQLVQKQIVIAPYDPLSLNPNYLVMTVNEIYNVGANVAAAPHTYQLGLNSPNGANDLAVIRVTGFLNNVASKKFIASASLNRRYTNIVSYLGNSSLSAEVFYIDADSLTGIAILRIVDALKTPLTLSQLNAAMSGNSLYISLDITIEP